MHNCMKSGSAFFPVLSSCKMNFSSLQLFECHMDQIKTQDWFKFRFIYNSSRMDIVQHKVIWIRFRFIYNSSHMEIKACD